MARSDTDTHYSTVVSNIIPPFKSSCSFFARLYSSLLCLSFILTLSSTRSLSLSLVHVNTSKHTDLRKIFFSFSLESGIQFCAIIGTPYWISSIKRHRGTIFFCNVEDDLWETKDTPSRFPALNSPNATLQFNERENSIRKKREPRLLVSSYPSDGFLGERHWACAAANRNFAKNWRRVELYWPDGASLPFLPTENFLESNWFMAYVSLCLWTFNVRYCYLKK